MVLLFGHCSPVVLESAVQACAVALEQVLAINGTEHLHLFDQRLQVIERSAGFWIGCATGAWVFSAERVNDFATPCVMNLMCRVVLFLSVSFAVAVG